MQKKTKLVSAGAAVVAATLAVGGLVAAGGGDNDEPITGDALEEASRAALDATGGGEVTDTEIGDEESYYEVEVTREDGSQVDVQLDRDFNVVGQEPDSDEGDDD